MQAIQLCLIDTGSSTRSLSVLLSVVETSLIHEKSSNTSGEIISTLVCALHVLAMATIQGWHLIGRNMCLHENCIRFV